MKNEIKKLIEQNKGVQFPEGTCCANRCWECRYLERDNNAYNDGTRRCSWKNSWVSITAPACHKFSY